VRVYDDDTTQLLKYWDDTFKYINKAKNENGKVLVHCKMGISRSASVVVAYAMKLHHWSLPRSREFVKKKRTCVKPNDNFLKQLEIYEGILDASRQRHNSLWRSVSESSLRRRTIVDRKGGGASAMSKIRNLLPSSSSSSSADNNETNNANQKPKSHPNSPTIDRPKSWSHNDRTYSNKLRL
jgi:protein phosphatase slingshot